MHIRALFKLVSSYIQDRVWVDLRNCFLTAKISFSGFKCDFKSSAAISPGLDGSEGLFQPGWFWDSLKRKLTFLRSAGTSCFNLEYPVHDKCFIILICSFEKFPERSRKVTGMHLKKIHGALGLLEQELFKGYWEQVAINNWQFQELC